MLWLRAILRVRTVFCETDRSTLFSSTFNLVTLKDESLLINSLASNNCFCYSIFFQNGVNTLSIIDDAFLSKKLKILLGASDYV